MSATNHALIIPSPLSPLQPTIRSIPTPSPTQLVIRNSAIALNPVDNRLLSVPGFHNVFGIKSWPVVPGNDIAGVVHSVGSSITSFHPGDRVLAFTVISDNQDRGAFQEYTLVDATSVAKLPENVSEKEGSTLPSSILTAASLLKNVDIDVLTKGKLDDEGKGKTILVWGASSSVGSATVQIAKALGATVIATASAKHHARVQELGADVVVDYRGPNVVAELKEVLQRMGLTGFDATLDAASADLRRTAEVVAQVGGGKMMTVVPWDMVMRGEQAPEGVRVEFVHTLGIQGSEEGMRRVMNELTGEWLGDGRLRAHRVEVVEGGLGGIKGGLERLREGVSGVKLVVEV